MVGFIKTFEQYPQVKFWSLFQLYSKIVLKGFESEFLSKLNQGFTNHRCLYCAILKPSYNFKVKRAVGARYSRFLFQAVKNQHESHQSSLLN